MKLSSKVSQDTENHIIPIKGQTEGMSCQTWDGFRSYLLILPFSPFCRLDSSSASCFFLFSALAACSFRILFSYSRHKQDQQKVSAREESELFSVTSATVYNNPKIAATEKVRQDLNSFSS